MTFKASVWQGFASPRVTTVGWSLTPATGTINNGVYTAPAAITRLQTVTLTAGFLGKTAKATITLIPSDLPSTRSTPHFGNDGSQLTSYVPGKSMFVRSVFSSMGPDFVQYVDAFRAAQVNTLESGFYNDPGNNASSVIQWEDAFHGTQTSTVEAAVNDGFNMILTGDEIARGSPAVYDSISGPGTAWTPDPITYAFTWARNLGKVIGVEMVDEISSQFSVPFPQGQLGQPGGPQQISCVNDSCIVTWPSQAVVQNGAQTFLITGATSNPNLNRPVSNLYHLSLLLSPNQKNENGFVFNATGIGTQTFTAATDPNLTMEMFAAQPLPTASSTNYIHNDAISQIMSYINAVPNRPSITWPAAAAAPPANFGAWAAPGASDYSDIYFTYLNASSRTAYSISDGLAAFNFAWNAKYPFAQANKPTLMEVSDVGVSYNIVPTSIPVVSFDGTTLTLSQPHGIATATIGTTRLSLSGNSNSSLNGNYYVYKVVNPYTVQVYSANPTGPSVSAPTLTVSFFDGQTVTLNFPYAASLTSIGIQMDGTSYCTNADNFGQIATVSGSTYAPYNGNWYVLPSQFDNLIGSTTCTWFINLRHLIGGPSSTGGTASVIADNYYHAGVSTINAPGVTADLVAANIMYAAEKGAAGVRVYVFGGDANQVQQLNGCFANCYTELNANPLYNGAQSQANWQGLSNAFNLIDRIEPFLLQPQLPAPNYGPTMITGARTSSYGTLLMMTEYTNSPQVVNVDLTPYNPSGGPGTMYMMNGEELNQQSISGTSTQVTFTPGETVAFTFPAGN